MQIGPRTNANFQVRTQSLPSYSSLGAITLNDIQNNVSKYNKGRRARRSQRFLRKFLKHSGHDIYSTAISPSSHPCVSRKESYESDYSPQDIIMLSRNNSLANLQQENGQSTGDQEIQYDELTCIEEEKSRLNITPPQVKPETLVVGNFIDDTGKEYEWSRVESGELLLSIKNTPKVPQMERIRRSGGKLVLMPVLIKDPLPSPTTRDWIQNELASVEVVSPSTIQPRIMTKSSSQPELQQFYPGHPQIPNITNGLYEAQRKLKIQSKTKKVKELSPTPREMIESQPRTGIRFLKQQTVPKPLTISKSTENLLTARRRPTHMQQFSQPDDMIQTPKQYQPNVGVKLPTLHSTPNRRSGSSSFYPVHCKNAISTGNLWQAAQIRKSVEPVRAAPLENLGKPFNSTTPLTTNNFPESNLRPIKQSTVEKLKTNKYLQKQNPLETESRKSIKQSQMFETIDSIKKNPSELPTFDSQESKDRQINRKHVN